MTQQSIFALTILLFVFSKCCRASEDLLTAVTIAQETAQIESVDIKDYQLVQIKNLVLPGPDYRGTDHWRVTFLSKHIIGRGKGGQLYIDLNVRTKSAHISYGE